MNTPLEDLFDKIGKNTPLTAVEQMRLLQEVRQLEETSRLVKTWTNSARGPVLSEAGYPIWESSPLRTLTFSMLTNTNISHDTDTYITFDYWVNDNEVFSRNNADASQIFVRGVGKSFCVVGYANWTFSANGYRKIHLEGFKSDGSSIGNTPLHTAPGNALVDHTIPIAYAASWQQFPDLAYLKFFVRQTSGGLLTLLDCVLNIFMI